MSMSGDGRTVIGSGNSFWLFDQRDGFDLTHPSTPDGPAVHPRLTLQTSTAPVTIAPHKSAIVIIDMQNWFLSPAVGRTQGPGHAALEALITKGIPAARKAQIPIIWLCWGISDDGLKSVPPIFYRGFGYISSNADAADVQAGAKQQWRQSKYGLGEPLGTLTLEDGTSIEGGRLLMKDQWNTELYSDLQDVYREGTSLSPADKWFHKESHSGFWGGNSEFAQHLKAQDIKTLFFAGVNTDQCVLGTMLDAVQQGYDTIMLQDACGTSSPMFAQQTVEFNAEKAFGFRTTCADLLDAAEHQHQYDTKHAVG